MEAFVQKLKERLELPLPGIEAQYQMAPLHRERVHPASLKQEDYRLSAVMIALCEDGQGNLFVPLTERVSYNGVHSGQISFPGGKFEHNDRDLEQTAIRECFEEIGLGDLEVIGKLTEIYIAVSKFLVHPYIAICRQKNPRLVPQEREVKSVVRLDLAALLNQEIIEHGTIEVMQNLKLQTPWFRVEGHRVWGATAMILNELKLSIQTIS